MHAEIEREKRRKQTRAKVIFRNHKFIICIERGNSPDLFHYATTPHLLTRYAMSHPLYALFMPLPKEKYRFPQKHVAGSFLLGGAKLIPVKVSANQQR